MGGRIASNVYGYDTGQMEYFAGQLMLTPLEDEDKCHTVVIYVIFKWFIPVVWDYNIKYQNDIRWVSQNTTLYYGVRCQKKKPRTRST